MDDSLAPPRATITNIIKETLGGIKFSNQYVDLIMEASKEYIQLLAAEANKICLGDGKKTIAPDHVFRALSLIKFDEYTKEVSEAHDIYLKETEEKNKGKNKLESQEEYERLSALQQKLFESSRNFNSMSQVPNDGNNYLGPILTGMGNQISGQMVFSESNLEGNMTQITNIQNMNLSHRIKEQDSEDYEDF